MGIGKSIANKVSRYKRAVWAKREDQEAATMTEGRIDEWMVRSACQGILGRSPSESEVAGWMANVYREGVSCAELLRRFVASDEARSRRSPWDLNRLVDIAANAVYGEGANDEARETLLAAGKEGLSAKQVLRALVWDPELVGRAVDRANRERWVFLHIPKTGGVSLLQWWKSQVPDDEALTLETRTTLDRSIPGDVVSLLPCYTLISGHFGLPAAEQYIKGPKKLVTVLREPVARVLSTYRFWKSYRLSYIDASLKGTLAERHIMSAKKNSLGAWLMCQDPQVRNEIDNAQTRYLTGLWVSPEGDDPLKDDPGGAIRLAKTNLNRFFAVGTTVHLDSFMTTMASKMGRTYQGQKVRQNVTEDNIRKNPGVHEQVQMEPLTDEIQNTLSQMNDLDRQIYDYVLVGRREQREGE